MQRLYDLEEHEVALLLTMCRAHDQMDALVAVVDREGAVDGTGRANPALMPKLASPTTA